MKRKPATPVRDRTVVSVYPEAGLYVKLKQVAETENRSLGNMAGKILELYLSGLLVTLQPSIRLLVEQEARKQQCSVDQMVNSILERELKREKTPPIGSGG